MLRYGAEQVEERRALAVLRRSRMGAAAAHGAHTTTAAPATSAEAGGDGLAAHTLRRAPQVVAATRRASCSESDTDDAEVVACELDLVDSAAWEPTELLPPPPLPPRQVMAAVEAAQQLATDGVGERGDGDSKGGWTPDSRLSNGQMSSLDAQVR